MSVLYTIGFTGKNARTFFGLLEKNKIKVLLDVRLNNSSQLAGYTKKDDLTYFLESICHIKYKHILALAPTKEILQAYKKNEISWKDYEYKYLKLLESKNIYQEISNIDLNGSCLLCSEKTAECCHRRLAAEYIQKMFAIDKIIHI